MCRYEQYSGHEKGFPRLHRTVNMGRVPGYGSEQRVYFPKFPGTYLNGNNFRGY